MVARRLTTMRPAMTLAEALETTRIHCIDGRTGAGTAVVMARPCRAPHQTIAEGGWISRGRCRGRAKFRGPTTACAAWMHGRSASGMSSRPCASRSRRVSYPYNLPHVLDLAALVLLAQLVARVQTATGS
jgi:Magnesium chelatase, subunit ChlI